MTGTTKRRSAVLGLPAPRVALAAALALAASSCALPTEPHRVAERVRETVVPTSAPAVGSQPSGVAVQTAQTGERSRQFPNANTGVSKTSIKLGIVALMSGGLRSVGEYVLRPSMAFVEMTNARGGINGRKLELVSYPGDVAGEDKNLAAVKRLVEEDKVFAVVNTYSALSQFGSAAAYLEEKGIPHIGGGSPRYSTDALAPQTFNFAPTFDVSGYFLANQIAAMLRERGAVKRVGITWVNNGLYTAIERFAERRLKQLGIEITARETVASTTDAIAGMDTVVAKLRASGAQGVIAVNNANWTFGLIAAKRQGWKVPWVTFNAWAKLFLDNGGDALEGQATSTLGLDFPDVDSPGMRDLREAFARYYPEGPVDSATMQAWLNLSVLSGVIRNLGDSVTRDGVIRGIAALRDSRTGLASSITITPKNHLGMKETMAVRVKGGRFVREGKLSRPDGLP